MASQGDIKGDPAGPTIVAPELAALFAQEKKGFLEKLLKKLEKFGKARDGMLVALVFVYILGFTSWAIYSWHYGIGFIRIFDAQYLIAGIVPTVSFSIVYASWHFFDPKGHHIGVALAIALPLFFIAILITLVRKR